MKVDFWFEFNQESSQTLINFNEALGSFVKKDDLTIAFRSNTNNLETSKFHQLYHLLKREIKDINFLIDLENLYLSHHTIEEAIHEVSIKYKINKSFILENIDDEKYKKVILNHKEHALLSKINQSPAITMSHGFKLFGLNSKDMIKDKLILMYEKDSGIEYCEENCER